MYLLLLLCLCSYVLVWDIVLSFVLMACASGFLNALLPLFLLLFRRACVDVILLLSLCDCCVVVLLS